MYINLIRTETCLTAVAGREKTYFRLDEKGRCPQRQPTSKIKMLVKRDTKYLTDCIVIKNLFLNETIVYNR